MGGLSGAVIAQSTHEGILQGSGGRLEREVLKYSKASPASHHREGAYVDDRLSTMQLPRARLRCAPGHDPACTHCRHDGGVLMDVVVNQLAPQAYESARAPKSVDKEFRYQRSFKSWGTEVNGETGTVAAPIDVRRQLFRLGTQSLQNTSVSKALMQSLLGGLPYPFQHAKHLIWRCYRNPTAGLISAPSMDRNRGTLTFVTS